MDGMRSWDMRGAGGQAHPFPTGANRPNDGGGPPARPAAAAPSESPASHPPSAPAPPSPLSSSPESRRPGPRGRASAPSAAAWGARDGVRYDADMLRRGSQVSAGGGACRAAGPIEGDGRSIRLGPDPPAGSSWSESGGEEPVREGGSTWRSAAERDEAEDQGDPSAAGPRSCPRGRRRERSARTGIGGWRSDKAVGLGGGQEGSSSSSMGEQSFSTVGLGCLRVMARGEVEGERKMAAEPSGERSTKEAWAAEAMEAARQLRLICSTWAVACCTPCSAGDSASSALISSKEELSRCWAGLAARRTMGGGEVPRRELVSTSGRAELSFSTTGLGIRLTIARGEELGD